MVVGEDSSMVGLRLGCKVFDGNVGAEHLINFKSVCGEVGEALAPTIKDT